MKNRITVAAVVVAVMALFAPAPAHAAPKPPPHAKAWGVKAQRDGLSIVNRVKKGEPGWDCATMGNRVCGSPDAEAGQWVPLTDEVADAMAEGVDDPMSIPSSKDGCLMLVDPEWNVIIRCADGRVFRS